jgi:uncharacterized protein
MPEYLAPGVYVEETSFRSKSIEGVSTTTTGFVGPVRFGPVTDTPEIITGLGEFERAYGGGQPLGFTYAGGKVTGTSHNFVWHAARAFFVEGGKRLYISRVFRPLPLTNTGTVEADASRLKAYAPPDANADTDAIKGAAASIFEGLYADGHARVRRTSLTPGVPPAGGGATPPATPGPAKDGVLFRARYPGAQGNVRLRLSIRLGQNLLGRIPDPNDANKTKSTLGALHEHEVVWIKRKAPDASGFFSASFDAATQEWTFTAGTTILKQSDLDSSNPKNERVRSVTFSIGVLSGNEAAPSAVVSDLAPDPRYSVNGALSTVFSTFSMQAPTNLPIVVLPGSGLKDGLAVLKAFGKDLDDAKAAFETEPEPLEFPFNFALEGGNDGLRPGATEYEGQDNPDLTYKTGLKQLEDLEDISIVASPGSMSPYIEEPDKKEADGITNLLIAHATNMRYRIAVLDCAQNQTVGAVRKMRAKLDSKYAALYYPWVQVLDPISRSEISLPPSGFVAGIYARNDINRAVYKAPANEVVNLALGFEQLINKGQQDVLNPEGINCFRYFEGRGMLLWGARTISSDPEWKYVNLRRYFAYLERSIDKGTQWAVFEPNGPLLWDNVRRTIEDFLFNEFQMGALLGDKPERSYFVKCDRTTMTQNDLDNGRLVCLVGVAPLRPAEYVIFRVGQWTGDRKV